MRMMRVFAMVGMSLVAAAPVFAQAAPQRVRTPRAWTEPGTGYRAYVVFDRVTMAAEDSFEAVLGTSSPTAIGGGGEFRFWKGLFARGAFSMMEESGTRVFIITGEPVSTGVPVTVEMRPIEISAGWRLPLDRGRRFVAYGGGGLLYVGYRETSEFAEPGEDTDDSFSGTSVFGGLDVLVWRWISAGVELQYRRVPDALGREGSVSAEFEETDLGGTAIRFLVGIRR